MADVSLILTFFRHLNTSLLFDLALLSEGFAGLHDSPLSFFKSNKPTIIRHLIPRPDAT
jgi:hypothetical protein